MEIKDKICLITGATSGIGLALSEKFASTGGELILIARNRHRGERIIKHLFERFENYNIRLFTADLSSFREIEKLSGNIHSQFKRIDILINNAGAFYSKYHRTIDGIEATFAVNYLSRFLLTNHLLDLLMHSPSGRIINISGENYRKGTTDFKQPDQRNFTPIKAISQSKLADMLFVMELSRRLQGSNLSINAMHPGAVATNIIYSDPDASLLRKAAYSFVRYFYRTPKKAAEDIFHLATAQDLIGNTGKYYWGIQLKEPAKIVYDEEIAVKLWELSEKLTGYSSPILNKTG